ncbi:2-oxoglutarate dehydrogenase complex dihydrolipoyllysine-residue succinyltransferase [Alloalcanivorax gelatiniphagus]|mgnify:CR=1 FL=1|uniref:Dihydrolipoyllysine-residue succinyltransferase component of 2-oxoglutarate dehydrogenase complex n=1 Tax=Alloalcanivorax gelatiniphagus TaxID=1194167 RepID=A0ABY2XNY9_9GAMM|nr:2-oxoglutarate dehydrogenase complex dihydrolipoyllysine-residue succinyltransferase [Alloalcanivorax gelatiniphagus]TMW13300.1 2-oxoglutarate dehydrogenase complex dihydrolipoyllysine-residue succinyltransferase [Alloalcanivorax gelatiniphagus]|tara:strand:- start:2163 stop:3425 length:1263 start_codon:yes stop_codon:yes gene_type:complete
MATEIKAPQFPESVADGTVATWHKKEGEAVKRDELLVDIETDKVVLEVVAPSDGVVGKILKDEGDTVESQEVLGHLEAGSGSGGGAAKQEESKSEAKADEGKAEEQKTEAASESAESEGGDGDAQAGPAARKLMSEHGLSAGDVKGTGRDGRITKEDVEKALANRQEKPASSSSESKAAPIPEAEPGEREERRVPMTRLRKRIAERLVSAQQNAAMLTTFNEVNMKPIMDMRKNYKDAFEKAHGVRLGFMGFFTRACVEALKRYPEVNASIDGDDVVYHGYYDVGVAVSTERGLVVPVVRDADQKGLAEVESQIIDYGQKAQKGKLSIEEMTGGTFTISNGGVFGSLMSMPILNPPQTAILGMHKIQERPMAVDGKVEILPMMYLALSYDHRLIDGKQAVQFLVTVKNFIEDPARLLLDI